MSEEIEDEISLKWGSLKGYSLPNNPEALELIKELNEMEDGGMGFSMSEEAIEKLCEVIDVLDGKIYLCWDGEYVEKEEAKEYVRTYRD